MDYLYTIILGVVQGITEFLPISSSGHLLILHNVLDFEVSDQLAFDVMLHLATLASVVICFWSEIVKLARSFIFSLIGKHDEYSRTAWLIVLATIPAGILGFLFDDFIENSINNNASVGIIVVITMLILIGILFILVEKIAKGELKYTDLGWKKAVFVGFAQALALIPGTSRSGITIIAGIKTGMKRQEALKFSFLLSIPIIIGANIIKIPSLFSSGFATEELTVMMFGAVSALVSGVLAIRFFLKFAQSKTLAPFAYYRFILAAVLIIYLLVF
ncbi:undecaprenyl-diphosphatase UppP [Candidatus Parcubacteria bacterium]|nr:MAG: undecaprenyl-diphosphatase UppP [Candidatus Parcubacteria bacterium]